MLARPDRSGFSVVLEAPDARELAAFYRDLLGWTTRSDSPEWVVIAPDGDARAYLSFNTSPEYEPPVWPPSKGEQQMMLHLDLEVSDLGPAVDEAVRLGAMIDEFQPQSDVCVLRDPAGHPFCLWVRTSR